MAAYGKTIHQFMTFNTADAGTAFPAYFQNPSVAGTRLGAIDTTGTGMPLIHINVSQSTLGTGRATYTLTIQRTDGIFSLTGKHLFRLPNTAGALPVYVPGWTWTTTSSIDIRIDTTGSFDLVFGTLPTTTPTVSAPAPVVYDFSVAPAKLNVTLTGTGFRTANPLIVAVPILAGGRNTKTFFSSANSYIYPSASANSQLKFVLMSKGIRPITDSIKAERSLSYYQRIQALDTTPYANTSEKKPVVLPNNLTTVMLTAAVSSDTDLAVDASGNLSVALPVRLTAGGWKDLGQQRSRGIELAITVFDGGAVSRAKAFIRSKFAAGDFAPLDRTRQFDSRRWNLYSYPWDEQEGGAINRLVDTGSNYRVMRYTGTGSTGYQDLTNADFSNAIDSGRAFWSGNNEVPYKPKTEGGTSLDYQPFALPLVAGQWNDFGLPFNFPIRLKDIIAASPGAGGLHFWKFKDSINAAGSWVALDTNTEVLIPWAGYTVKPSAAMTLNFPVRDTGRTATPPAPKQAATAGWTAKFEIGNSTAVAELRVGKGSQPDLIEEAPFAPGQNFRAAFHVGENRWSGIREDIATGLAGHWPLDVTPLQGFSSVTLSVSERRGETPSLYLVETLSGTSQPLEGPVTLSAHDLQQGDYHIVAGDADYAQSFLKNVGAGQRLVNFPNPFLHDGTTIRFTLPSTFTEVDYQARIFDFHGRMVWEKSWKGGSLLNTFWDGKDLNGQRVPTGQYHLLMTAQVPGKQPFRAQRNLIKLQ